MRKRARTLLGLRVDIKREGVCCGWFDLDVSMGQVAFTSREMQWACEMLSGVPAATTAALGKGLATFKQLHNELEKGEAGIATFR